MINLDATLAVAAIAGVTTAAALVLMIISWKAKRRTKELMIANKAMATYYTLVEKIIDDPALPDDAAEFLAILTEILPNKNKCSNFATGMIVSNGISRNGNKAKGDGERMFDIIEGLGRTRPDLRDDFHSAIANGVVALFHRWPGDSVKFSQMMQEIATDRKKEFQIVYRFKNNNQTDVTSGHALA